MDFCNYYGVIRHYIWGSALLGCRRMGVSIEEGCMIHTERVDTVVYNGWGIGYSGATGMDVV